ncbi:MAG: NTP transferase domain-containing protein [Chloroflexi bacterium]|nr:NTP transferase domain-containing protein [Chloroflexota bacterium]
MKRQVDKALVLVGGSGTRLRPFTYSITKQLLPIANKPVLFYILEKVRALGVREIGLVVSAPHAKETIRIVGDGSRWDARFTYLVQEEPRGLADTVRISREFLGSSSFLMVLGDNVYGFDFAGIVADFLAHPCDGLLVTQRVEEPTRYGIVVVQPDGSVKSVVEKPSEALSDLALLGIYIFSPEIHRVMDSISPSDRGELELTNAVMGVIKAGRMVRHFSGEHPQGPRVHRRGLPHSEGHPGSLRLHWSGDFH